MSEFRVINVEKGCVRNAHWRRTYKGYEVELKLKETCEYVEFVVELTVEQQHRLEAMETFTMEDLKKCNEIVKADEEWQKDEEWDLIGEIPDDIREELDNELEMMDCEGDTIDIDGWTKVSDTEYVLESGGLKFMEEQV